MLVLYHNTRCSKSRECLNIIKKKNIEYEIVEYLKVELDKNVIKKIVYGLKKELPLLIRSNEKSIQGYKINFDNLDSIIDMIYTHKECLQRPIVFFKQKYIICRPPDKILQYIK